MSKAPAPAIGRLEWYLLLAGVLIQQAAFIPIPESLSNPPPAVDNLGLEVDPASSNPLNFTLTVGYLGIIAVLSLARLSSLVATIKQNPLVIATTALVVVSVLWSFDPALSVRRAATYSIGVWLAAYMVTRCDLQTIIRILATSTLIGAVGTVVYAGLYPDYANMQEQGVQGLRGVFSHKNQLAEIMAIGFLLQLYLAMTTGRWRWHLPLAVLHAVLVVMAKSTTSTVSLGLLVALLAWLQVWRFNRQLGMTGTLAAGLLVLLVAAWGFEDPDAFFAVLGRDASLTGRTDLWPALWPFIVDRIWLGWGFNAFWQVGNPAAQHVWAQVTWPPPHSHNGALEVMVDFGVVGLALVLLLLVRYGLYAARLTARDPGPDSQLFWCILALAIFNNIVEITLLRTQTFPWFSYLVFHMAAAAIVAGRAAVAAPSAEAASAAAAPALPKNSVLARAKPLPRPATDGGRTR